jgi:hypothetical protein
MKVLDRQICPPSSPEPELIIREARTRGRRRKAASALLIFVVVGAAAIVAGNDGPAGRSGSPIAKLSAAAAAPGGPSEVTKPGGCGGTVLQLGKLPPWTAFAGVPSPALHAMSKNGTAVGVFFSSPPPLHYGPPLNPRNKILWLVRSAHGSLIIRARPLGSSRPATLLYKASEGTGAYMVPSYDNVTKSGCWAFMLNEGNTTDTLDLYYKRG